MLNPLTVIVQHRVLDKVEAAENRRQDLVHVVVLLFLGRHLDRLWRGRQIHDPRGRYHLVELLLRGLLGLRRHGGLRLCCLQWKRGHMLVKWQGYPQFKGN